MKTTLYIPNDLHRALKIEAAKQSTTVTALVVEGIKLVLGRTK